MWNTNLKMTIGRGTTKEHVLHWSNVVCWKNITIAQWLWGPLVEWSCTSKSHSSWTTSRTSRLDTSNHKSLITFAMIHNMGWLVVTVMRYDLRRLPTDLFPREQAVMIFTTRIWLFLTSSEGWVHTMLFMLQCVILKNHKRKMIFPKKWMFEDLRIMKIIGMDFHSICLYWYNWAWQFLYNVITL